MADADANLIAFARALKPKPRENMKAPDLQTHTLFCANGSPITIEAHNTDEEEHMTQLYEIFVDHIQRNALVGGYRNALAEKISKIPSRPNATFKFYIDVDAKLEKNPRLTTPQYQRIVAQQLKQQKQRKPAPVAAHLPVEDDLGDLDDDPARPAPDPNSSKFLQIPAEELAQYFDLMLEAILAASNRVLLKVAMVEGLDLDPLVAKRTPYNIHIVFPTVFVTQKEATSIIKALVDELKKCSPDYPWTSLIDSTVYNNGLRMLGCKKTWKTTPRRKSGATAPPAGEVVDQQITDHQELFGSLALYNESYVPVGMELQDIDLDVFKQHALLFGVGQVNVLPPPNPESTKQRQLNSNITNNQMMEAPDGDQFLIEMDEDAEDDLEEDPMRKVLEEYATSQINAYNQQAEVTQPITPVYVGCKMIRADQYALALAPGPCPFKGSQWHNRCTEGRSANFVYIFTYQNLPLRAHLGCQAEAHRNKKIALDSCQNQEAQISYHCQHSFDTQTDETVAEFVYQLVKDRFATSPTGSKTGYDWWRFEPKQHRWRPLLACGLDMMAESGDVQQAYRNYFNKHPSKASGDVIESYKKLVFLLQSQGKTKGSFVPRIAEKLAYYGRNEDDRWTADQMDSKGHLMGFRNGVYDFNEMEFRPGRPDDYICNSTRTRYREWSSYDLATQQKLIEFLERLMPEKDAYEYMIRRIALSLNGSVSKIHFAIFTGKGANGKSELMRMISESFGGYFGSIAAEFFTDKPPGPSAPREELLAIIGKRWISCPEAGGQQHTMQLETIKLVTGGDDIVARGLYGKTFRFVPQGQWNIQCNDIPQMPISSNDEAMERRLDFHDFRSKFTNNTRLLAQNQAPVAGGRRIFRAASHKELKELHKIFPELFMSYLVYRYKDFADTEEPPMPAASQVLFNEVLKSNLDCFDVFVKEAIECDDSHFTSTVQLFTDFQSFRKRSGIPARRTQQFTSFVKEMCALPQFPQQDGPTGDKGWRVRVKVAHH